MRAGQTCGTCVFFARFEGNPAEGDCRFNPPTVVMRRRGDDQPLTVSDWPMVQLTWWCGRWEKQWDPEVFEAPTTRTWDPVQACTVQSPDRPRLLCERPAGHAQHHGALLGQPNEVAW